MIHWFDSTLPLLIDNALKGVVLLLVAWLVVLIMRRTSASLRQLVWASAMVCLILLPLLPALPLQWRLPLLPSGLVADSNCQTHSAPLLNRDPVPFTLPGSKDNIRSKQGFNAFSSPSDNRSAETLASMNSQSRPVSGSSPGLSFNWRQGLILFWFGGAVLCLLPFLLGNLLIYRISRKAKPINKAVLNGMTKYPVRILPKNITMGPMTWGLFRPIILMPHNLFSWSIPRQRMALCHEIAHARRKDCLIQTLSRLALALHWFNPLAWMAMRGLKGESEKACDDKVLHDGLSPYEYAGFLLQTARAGFKSRGMPMAALTMAGFSQLESRMTHILDTSQNRKSMALGSGALLFSATATLLLLLSIVQCAVSQPLMDKANKYLVISDLSQDDPYHKAAERLAAHRKGEILGFDPNHLETLLHKLKKKKPRFVAIVTRPETVDTNFIRRFLMMSTRVDEDPFSDFVWGVITAITAEDTLRFVENMIKAEKEGLPKKVINSYVSTRCDLEENTTPAWLKKKGYHQASLGFGTKDPPEKLTGFVDEHLKELEGCGVVQMTGCGDPERIWLFDDQRNMDDSKHWDYIPEKVGYNPKGDLIWIDADKIKKLNLYPAVLTSGVCHGGSLKKVFVEGDIVSTFGRTEKVEVYDMPKEKSLGLAYLSSGVTAAFLPVGANHGWRTCVEVGYMLQSGGPLGDVIKAGHDELVLAYNGAIDLGLHVPGSTEDADPDIDAIMRGGMANRVLYGDPAYAPFEKLHSSSIKISEPLKKEDGSYQVDCTVTAPFSYSDRRTAQWVDQFTHHQSRIFFSIQLPEDLSTQGVSRVTLMNPPESEKDFEVRWAEERDQGEHRLHIMVLSPKPATESFLCAQEGRMHSLLIEKAQTPEQRVSVSPKIGDAEKKLQQLWHYEWEEWRFQDVLVFIEELWGDRNHDKGVSPKFRFIGEAALKKDSVITMTLTREPLKAGLDRVCDRLGIKYETDKTGWLITFSDK